VFTAIRDRRSYRAFLEKPVTLEQIHQILDVARFAPSGKNTQPWHVVAVTGDIITQIGDAIVTTREANIPENPDYQYYPTTWIEPYDTRRKICGYALYSAVNIDRHDMASRKIQWYKNYYFFGAPVGLLFFLDNILEKGSWVDMGIFVENVMLAARGLGLETCPQASFAEYPDIVRQIVDVPKEKSLMCGMSLGYADYQHPINNYRTERAPVEKFTKFVGF
jgi:nitroreductase